MTVSSALCLEQVALNAHSGRNGIAAPTAALFPLGYPLVCKVGFLTFPESQDLVLVVVCYVSLFFTFFCRGPSHVFKYKFFFKVPFENSILLAFILLQTAFVDKFTVCSFYILEQGDVLVPSSRMCACLIGPRSLFL